MYYILEHNRNAYLLDISIFRILHAPYLFEIHLAAFSLILFSFFAIDQSDSAFSQFFPSAALFQCSLRSLLLMKLFSLVISFISSLHCFRINHLQNANLHLFHTFHFICLPFYLFRLFPHSAFPCLFHPFRRCNL